MKKFSILAGVALLGATGAALAQPGSTPRFDRNADVTRQQVIERSNERFARLDSNGDGRATREEAQQAHEQRRAERAGRMFERLDANRDGSISRAEFDQARAQRAEHRGERRPGRRMRAMHGRHGGPGMHGEHGGRGEQLFGEQGFVTREQMQERALARFDRMDANRDGTLTATERRQAREQFRQQRRERSGETN